MRAYSSRRLTLALLLGVVVTMLLASGALAARLPDADQGGRPFTVAMTGTEEAPGPGDPDGSGTAVFTLNQGQGTICYMLTVEAIAPATVTHIHRAPAGVAGSIVVPLIAPTDGSSSGCVDVDRDLINDIKQNPESYYVNVHNADFPAGAVRGQISK